MTNFLVSLAVALSVAAVTVWLSLRRFRTERWWDRKAEAYSRIINALHALAEHAGSRAEAELGDPRAEAELVDRYAEEEVKRQKEAGDSAWVELQRVTEIGAFVISSEAANALHRLRHRSRVDLDEGDWYSLYSEDHAAYKKALAEMRSLAQKDLRVAGALSGWARLGIALSGVWVVLAPVAYFLGRASYPSWWTTAFDKLYAWVPSASGPVFDPTLNMEVVPGEPQLDVAALGLFVAVPVLAGWLVLFLLPRTIRWVREGFSKPTSRP